MHAMYTRAKRPCRVMQVVASCHDSSCHHDGIIQNFCAFEMACMGVPQCSMLYMTMKRAQIGQCDRIILKMHVGVI